MNVESPVRMTLVIIIIIIIIITTLFLASLGAWIAQSV